MISGSAMLKPCKSHLFAVCRYRWVSHGRQLRVYSIVTETNPRPPKEDKESAVERTPRPAASTSGTSHASWGATAISPAPGAGAVSRGQIGDGMLLPHERAARDRALAGKSLKSAPRPPAPGLGAAQRDGLPPQRDQGPAASSGSQETRTAPRPATTNSPPRGGVLFEERPVQQNLLRNQKQFNEAGNNAQTFNQAERARSGPHTLDRTWGSASSSFSKARDSFAPPNKILVDELLPNERAARARLSRRERHVPDVPSGAQQARCFRLVEFTNEPRTRPERPILTSSPQLDPKVFPSIRSRPEPGLGRRYGSRNLEEQPSRSFPGPASSSRERPGTSMNKLKVFDSKSSAEDSEWSGLMRQRPARGPPGTEPDDSNMGPVFPSRAPRDVSAKGREATDDAGDSGFWAQVKQRYPTNQPQTRNPTGASFWEEFEKNMIAARGTERARARKEVATPDWADDDSEKKKKAKDVEEHGPRPGYVQNQEHAVNPEYPYPDLDETQGRSGRAWRNERDRPEKIRKPKVRRRETGLGAEEDDDWEADKVMERRQRKAERKAQKERERLALEQEQAGPPAILLPEFINIQNLATALGVKSAVFLEKLGELGFENINLDSIMTGETAALVAQEYGFEPTVDAGDGEDLKPRPPPDDPSSLPPRPPVVTIMGHVDHGKTTLLDWLRKSSIVAQEHGGITQHIGAFSVNLSSGKQITFLDTPGHAAFLNMRQRGANITDIVILVVAGDDSVKPQTLEALRHARAAKVPMIVAISKIDKDEARIDNVKADLAQNGVEIEEYGGDVQVVGVSGKTGQGMQDLEENIVLLSEILDMRAEVDGMAEGWVLESTIKQIGRVATVLVKRGTLRQGDYIVAGTGWGKIRSMRNEAGVEVQEAPPGTPVKILGWKEPPDAGDQMLQAPDEGKAKAAVRYRQELKEREEAVAQMAQQEEDRRERERVRAEADSEEAEPGTAEQEASEPPGTKMVNLTVKGDVHGSVEAICAAIMEIGNNEVRPRILRSGPGHITEFDVEHAGTAGALIVNFNNPIPGHIRRQAEGAGVKILDHNVIYRLTDEIREIMSQYLTPTINWKVLGEAEVLQVYRYNIKRGQHKNVAGCRVRNGALTASARYRVVRGSETIFQGALQALKHGKSDITEAKKGSECGISFVDWEDFREGDQVQAVEEIREKREL